MPRNVKKKPGRPPLPPGERKRVPLNMRTTQELRDKIEAAARASGRSLVQEVEYRIERSFLEDDQRTQEFGGEKNYALLRLLGAAISLIEAGTGKSWREDRPMFQQVSASLVKLLDELGPTAGDKLDDSDLVAGTDEIMLALIPPRGGRGQSSDQSRSLISLAVRLSRSGLSDSERSGLVEQIIDLASSGIGSRSTD